MGEVYKARDTRLDRTVAIKVLPADVAADPHRRERFRREARAISSLTHPNVCALYDIGEQSGVDFLVMEYLEGETLAHRLLRGALPLEEALSVGVQLADALEAAHAAGVIHRDLKPANVMLTARGAKVLDFGLAKWRGSDHDAAVLTSPVTAHATLTQVGALLGTIQYMAPEQVEGKPIDARVDLFALGTIIYEMVTGRKAFEGANPSSVTAAILTSTPAAMSSVEPLTPSSLDRVVKKCLAKDPAKRWQAAGDLRDELAWGAEDLAARVIAVASHPRSLVAPTRWWPRTVITSVVLAGLALMLAWHWTSTRSIARVPVGVEATFTRLTSEPGMELFPSLSPDGRWIVYSSRASGQWAIYLRSVGGQQAFNLTKDSSADDTQPAFSPDGEQIAFRSERDGGGLFVMARTGESVRRLTDTGFNPTWSPKGDEIAFADEEITINPRFGRGSRSALRAVNVATGAKRLITDGDAVQPSWSPHGDRIAYWPFRVDGGQRDVWTISARGGTAVRVTVDPAVHWNPVWAPDGKFLYFASDRGGSLNVWRVAIDEPSGRVLGRPEAVTTPSPFVGHLSLAADGRHLAYASIVSTTNLQRLTFDPVTQTLGRDPAAVTRGSRSYGTPDFSPDGAWLTFASADSQEDIFVSRMDGTSPRQVTNDVAHDRGPHWSPDGQRIAFFSDRGGRYNVWSIHPDGSGLEQLTDGDAHMLESVWSPDGSRMTVSSFPDGGVYLFDPRIPWHQQQPQRLPSGPRPFTAWSWSPDGTRLAGWWGPPGSGIATYSIESGTYQTVADVGKAPVWLNDSKSLMFFWADNVFLAHLADPHHPRPLLSVAPDEVSDGLTISRDNRTVVFGRKVTEADIWLATLK
jgi:Tol biopolymer transport system component